jgi:hypothetical protein
VCARPRPRPRRSRSPPPPLPAHGHRPAKHGAAVEGAITSRVSRIAHRTHLPVPAPLQLARRPARCCDALSHELGWAVLLRGARDGGHSYRQREQEPAKEGREGRKGEISGGVQARGRSPSVGPRRAHQQGERDLPPEGSLCQLEHGVEGLERP